MPPSVSRNWISLYERPIYGRLVDLACETFEPLIAHERTVMGLPMVDLRGGVYVQGSPDIYSKISPASSYDVLEDNIQPPRWVGISPFSIGKTKVTKAQWAKVMSVNGKMPNPLFREMRNQPETGMSWIAAQTYLIKLNNMFYEQPNAFKESFKLLTEAQWEYAERGRPVDLREVIREEGLEIKDSAAFLNFSLFRFENFFSELGGKIYNAKVLGGDGKRFIATYSQEFLDLIFSDRPLYGFKLYSSSTGRFLDDEICVEREGNVSEWTNDTEAEDESDRESPVVDPIIKDETTVRIIRGASWLTQDRQARIAVRQSQKISFTSDTLGMTVALVPFVSAVNLYPSMLAC